MRRFLLAIFLLAVATAAVGGIRPSDVDGDEPSAGGHPLSYWMEELFQEDGFRRWEAERNLQEIGKPAVLALVAVLGPDDPIRRRTAADVLSHFGPRARSAVPRLAALLADDEGDEVLGDACGRALVAIGPPADTEALAVLKRGEASVEAQVRALDVASRLHAEAVVPEALSRLVGTDPYLRRAAAWALGHLGAASESALGDLTAALDSEDPPLREASTYALSRLGLKAVSARVALAKRLTDDHLDVRQMAAIAMTTTGDPDERALPALREAVESGEGWVTTRALAGLEKWAEKLPAAIDVIRAGISDDEDVRWEASIDASLALVRLGRADGKVVRALARSARGSAVVGHRRLGDEASAALQRMAAETPESLLPLFRDEDIGWVVAKAFDGAGESAAAVLKKALEGAPEGLMRRNLLAALGRLGTKAASSAPEILALLSKTGDGFSRDDLLDTLVSLRPSAEVWARLLRLAAQDERLGRPREKVEDPSFAAACVEAFSSRDHRVRHAAVRLVGWAGESAVQVLLDALRSPSEGVRRLASRALMERPLGAESSSLASLLASDDPDVVLAALRVPGDRSAPDEGALRVRVLAPLLRHADARVADAVLEIVLRGDAPDEGMGAVASALDAAPRARRPSLLSALVRLDAGSDRTLAALREHAKEDFRFAYRLAEESGVPPRVRAALAADRIRSDDPAALEEAARLGAPVGEESLPAVDAALASPDPKTRRLAVRLLSNEDVPAAQRLSRLAPRLDDPDPEVVATAISGLSSVPGWAEKTVPRLIGWARSADERISQGALGALALVRAPSKEAVEAVLSEPGLVSGGAEPGPRPLGDAAWRPRATDLSAVLRTWAERSAEVRAVLLERVAEGGARTVAALDMLAWAPALERWDPVVRAMASSDADVRRAAFRVAVDVEGALPRAAMGAASTLLAHEDDADALLAVQVLGRFGVEAKAFLPKIEARRLLGSDGWDGEDLRRALRSLRGEPPADGR